MTNELKMELRKVSSLIGADFVNQVLNTNNVNLRDQYGLTLFIYSIYLNQIKLAELLIKAGADVNMTNSVGDTALMYAIHDNNLEMVELLLNNGANPQIRNAEGETALDYAKRIQADIVIRYILSNTESATLKKSLR